VGVMLVVVVVGMKVPVKMSSRGLVGVEKYGGLFAGCDVDWDRADERSCIHC
jgi:hypothetical protein